MQGSGDAVNEIVCDKVGGNGVANLVKTSLGVVTSGLMENKPIAPLRCG